MKKRENSTERRNEVLILYSSIMVFLLAVSYVLIITNPPSDLLRYDNNLGSVVTIDNLSVSEIPEHTGSISIFLGLFAFLTFFIGISMSVIYEVEGGSWRCTILLITVLFLFPLLGLLLYPYYGIVLTATVVPVGYFTGLLGLSFSKRLRVKFLPSILMAFGLGVTSIAFLYEMISGLEALSILTVLMSLGVLWIELVALRELKKKLRPLKRRKKS